MLIFVHMCVCVCVCVCQDWSLLEGQWTVMSTFDWSFYTIGQPFGFTHKGLEARGYVNHVETDTESEWYNQLVPWAMWTWQSICNIQCHVDYSFTIKGLSVLTSHLPRCRTAAIWITLVESSTLFSYIKSPFCLSETKKRNNCELPSVMRLQ